MQDKNTTDNKEEKYFTKKVKLHERVCLTIENIAKDNKMDQDDVIEHLLCLGIQKAHENNAAKKAEEVNEKIEPTDLEAGD